MRKTVSVLTVDEHKITRTSSILQNFTEDLARKYSKVHIMPPLADDFIGENIFASLSAVERSLLDQPMSFTELTNALQKMKKGKSPGSNGYTACFFKFFWKELGPFLYRAFLFSASQGKTLLTHREGIITMIPKAGKPPDSVKGWRPITLLNIDFKIISSALSARLQSVVDKLIDPCQTAYIKGRYIGENTRLVYDVIEHLLARQKTSLIMSADFEAAFDSISWEFVRKALNHYGFGPYFKDMINTLYLNPNNFSRIIINGHLGDKIHLKCGIRQGDPASGYLFNLAVNILAQQIKRSDRITGIRLSESNEVKISQYADDTLLFLNNTSGCLQGALEELKTFSEASGLHLNIEKTACMEIGSPIQQERENSHGVKWVNKMKILGITFTNNNENITKVNFEPKVLQLEKEIAQWRRRHLTPIGRITVIKSLLVSKFVHLFTALPNPTQAELKQLERLFFQFLWAGKRDPVKRAKIVQDYAHGGLRMLDLLSFVKSMKISWLKRLATTNAVWGEVVSNELSRVQDILTYGSKKLLKISAEINNPFWKNVINALADFSSIYKPELPQILSESIWFSDHTKYKCSIVSSWNKKGVRFLGDLINEDSGKLHTKESLENAFGIKMTFLCFHSLIKSLPGEIKSATEVKESGPIIPLKINLIMNHPNFSRLVYNTYITSKRKEIARTNARQKEKWVRDVECFESGSIFELIHATRSTRILMFQYKLVNRFLATNKYLKIIKIKENDRCTFCENEPETIAHMFWYCSRVQSFINDVKTDILREYHIELDINRKTWFFPRT